MGVKSVEGPHSREGNNFEWFRFIISGIIEELSEVHWSF